MWSFVLVKGPPLHQQVCMRIPKVLGSPRDNTSDIEVIFFGSAVSNCLWEAVPQ